jgi:hypothetical protein
VVGKTLWTPFHGRQQADRASISVEGSLHVRGAMVSALVVQGARGDGGGDAAYLGLPG